MCITVVGLFILQVIGKSNLLARCLGRFQDRLMCHATDVLKNPFSVLDIASIPRLMIS